MKTSLIDSLTVCLSLISFFYHPNGSVIAVWCVLQHFMNYANPLYDSKTITASFILYFFLTFHSFYSLSTYSPTAININYNIICFIVFLSIQPLIQCNMNQIKPLKTKSVLNIKTEFYTIYNNNIYECFREILCRFLIQYWKNIQMDYRLSSPINSFNSISGSYAA